MYMVFSTLVNFNFQLMFSIVAMVIRMDASIPETTQLACYLNQCLDVVQSSELLCEVLFDQVTFILLWDG